MHTFKDKPEFNVNDKIVFGTKSNYFWSFYEQNSIRYQNPPYQNKCAAKLAKLHINSQYFSDFQPVVIKITLGLQFCRKLHCTFKTKEMLWS